MQSETAISRELMGKIVDEVFDGAIEDSRVIEEIYAIIKREEATVSAAEPVEGHVDWDNPNDPAVKLFVGFDVEAYVDEYELRGDEGDYSPNEQEKTLLVDAIYSVVGNLHESMRKLIPSSLPTQQTVSSAPVKTLRDAANEVIACASDTYKKRNGHVGSFEDDSGEKCWIVPFDAFEGLRSALAAQVQDVAQNGLTLSALQSAHVERQEEWCPDVKPDLSFRGNELGGECGEAQNVIKKLERERHGWRGSRDTVEHLAEELADVIHCSVLVAITAGVDLQQAVIAKFNDTSMKNGLSAMLPAAPAKQEGGQ